MMTREERNQRRASVLWSALVHALVTLETFAEGHPFEEGRETADRAAFRIQEAFERVYEIDREFREQADA